MATANPFDLLGDDDNDDVSQLAAKVAVAPAAGAQPKKAQVAVQPAKSAKLPTKPLPPSQAVKEGGRGGDRGYGSEGRGYGSEGRGYGRGRGGGGYNRERSNDVNSNGFSAGGYSKSEEGDKDVSERRGGGYGAPRGSFRGGRRGGYNNGEEGEGERPRRTYDRRSGTGRGGDFKRDGAGRGNWGTTTDEIAVEVEPGTEVEKVVDAEKLGETEAPETNKENAEEKEKEPEDNEMTLEEYQKVYEEKRKSLAAQKTEERKVELDKDLKSMQQLSSKKTSDEIFIKLGSEKDKKKEAAEKEERAKKVSINEFLKPADGESQRNYGGRRGGRGGRGRGGFGGEGRGGGYSSNTKPAPSIADTALFPSLGGK